jgi:hypothetical protein
MGQRGTSRREFLGLLAGLSGALATARLPAAHAATPDLVHDTLDGLIAFVVPGPDAYSIAQGVSTSEPGGIDAGVTDTLIEALDASVPAVPGFAATLAGVLNSVAQQVNPAADGPFLSPFARLSYGEKVAVFAALDATEPLKPVAGFLPAIVAFLAYSEAGVFDPGTRTLTGTPVGWITSHYTGVADGRDEFRGYFQNRRRAD